MGKRIEWTDSAILEFKAEIDYHKSYSIGFAEKFRISILQNIDISSKNPYFGMPTSIDYVRCKSIMRRFTIVYYYKEDEDRISIFRIWDNRRDPDWKFKKL